MYYPYFRGKQYELITIRESSRILADRNFVPIIEPVKSEVKSLEKTVDALREVDCSSILIINPQYGDFRISGKERILQLVDSNSEKSSKLRPGVLLTEKDAPEDIYKVLAKLDRETVLIHAGFSKAKVLANMIRDLGTVRASVFLDESCGKLYQRHFLDHPEKILIRDGFERRRNRDHPDQEFFSDLHVTFEMESMTGFGDFLIVGDEYSETGGPAYTVAIHLTYIDSDNENQMYICHFKSDRQNSPADPAGKFAEALVKLVAAMEHPNNKIKETKAVRKFLELHERGHYPGLGYVKKLSMLHHIEVLARYFDYKG